MLKKIFIVTILLIGTLQAITLKTTKELYNINEEIITNFTELKGNNKNWIAIYPEGSNNDWKNVLQWSWTKVENGNHHFQPLPEGQYQVRIFYNNSFKLEISKSFIVENNGEALPVKLTTNKESYEPNEKPTISFKNMSGDNKDWLAIYKVDSSNAWKNVIQWRWAKAINGEQIFDPLPVGDYEVRAFFKNSYKLETSKKFSVLVQPKITLKTTQKIYDVNEKPVTIFTNLSGKATDWLAIYPAGSSNEWKNVIQWDWARNVNGSHVFKPLPIGEYEVRIFLNNSFNLSASKKFSVQNLPISSKVYENAENGINPKWVKNSGRYNPIHYRGGGYKSRGALVLTTFWARDINGFNNSSSYSLALDADASKKVLELDIGGLANYNTRQGYRTGYMPHYNISIWFHTLKGPRRIIWDSFYNHNHITKPFLSNNGETINSPSPFEFVRGFGYAPVTQWNHFKVNIESVLQKFEPNNIVTSIDTFSATGGFLDNIKLSNR